MERLRVTHASAAKNSILKNESISMYTVLPVKNVRGQFAAFLSFKATDQRHIIILLFETLQFWF